MNYKSLIPIILTGFVAILVFVAFFTNFGPLVGITRLGMFWMIIIGGMASALGAVSLLSIHWKKVVRKEKEWYNSLILIVVLIGTVILGILLTPQARVYRFIFQYVFTPLTTALLAILAFFIASASFRAFRVRSFDAGVLVISALLVMLGKSTIGEKIWGGIPYIGQWVLDIPNTAGSRGILLGATLGAIAVFLRVILGIERGHFVGER
jgi:ABC-type transport system involved in cytochrome c biogenesis permease subunit